MPRGLTGNLRDTALHRRGEGTGRLRPITVRHRGTTAPLRPIMLRLHRVGTREAVIPEVVTQEAVVAIRQEVEAVVTRGAAGIPDTGDNGAFAVMLNAARQGGVWL